jgi:hypothetical protein
MSSFFFLELDTAAPANPTLLLNGGAAVTSAQVVQVSLATPDYQGGAEDVTQMKLWGDVDPTADPNVQTAEGASDWTDFATEAVVKLSAGSGRKTLYAKLRDDVLNETLVFSDFIDLDLTAPVVSISTAVDRSRISKVPGANLAIFGWQSSHAFTHYEVRVVPNVGSPHQAGVLIPATHGSVNTSDDGSFLANTEFVTQIRGADLEAASPGNTTKLIKVYVRDGSNVWSP